MSDHPMLYRDRPVVVGAGLAGLMTALSLAPEPVVLLSRAPLGAETSTAWAQGGLAASLADDDTPGLHLDDTLAAGAGLVEATAARSILDAAPDAVRRLAALGVNFDRNGEGFQLGLEAAHGRRRIVHADGDATGREIVRALVAAVRATLSITVLEGVEARRLLVEDGAIAGIVCVGPTGEAMTIATSRVVLATGGIGGLFSDSTNPRASQGQGLALAARAGALLSNLEFVQFHPTALDTAARPMGLVSEAVRGEGAVLIDETGERFLRHLPGAELAPRDEVARAIWQHLAGGHRVYLDARQRPGIGFARRFPGIDRLCRDAGFDPQVQPLPVRPAQHYHMGGIAVDGQGRTSLPGLWACGEVACTGLHGANRLASNSLAEATVCAGWVADSVRSAPAASRGLGAVSAASNASDLRTADAEPTRTILSRALGVVRDRAGLEAAIAELLPLATGTRPAAGPALVGLMLAVSALNRQESRGAHCRADFPSSLPAATPSFLSRDQALAVARDTAGSLPFAESA
jgi:L-aspartate oxidase